MNTIKLKRALELHPRTKFFIVRMGYLPFLNSKIHNFTCDLSAEDFLQSFLIEPESISHYEKYWSLVDELPDENIEYILSHCDEFNELIDLSEQLFFETLQAASKHTDIDLVLETSLFCFLDETSVVLLPNIKYDGFNQFNGNKNVYFRFDTDSDV